MNLRNHRKKAYVQSKPSCKTTEIYRKEVRNWVIMV